MQTLPPQVTVGLVDFDVVLEPTLEEQSLFGQILLHKGRIEIQPDMPPIVQWVTLWHETLHAVARQAGIQGDNEEIITAFAYAMPRLLRDNPALIK